MRALATITRSLSAAAAIGAALVVGVACQVVVDVGRSQCSTDLDCAARSLPGTCVQGACVATELADASADSGLDPRWACVGSVSWPPGDEGRTVRVRKRYVDGNDSPVNGADVQACGRLDRGPLDGGATCATPLATGTTDVEGYVQLTLRHGFDGYLVIAPPASLGAMPALDVVLPPPYADDPEDKQIPVTIAPVLFSAAQLDALLVNVGGKLDPAAGQLIGVALDCNGAAVAGVSLRTDLRQPNTLQWYVETPPLPSIQGEKTGARGEAGFINLPPGGATIKLSLFEPPRALGTISLPIRAGFITNAVYPPAPL